MDKELLTLLLSDEQVDPALVYFAAKAAKVLASGGVAIEDSANITRTNVSDVLDRLKKSGYAADDPWTKSVRDNAHLLAKANASLADSLAAIGRSTAKLVERQ